MGCTVLYVCNLIVMVIEGPSSYMGTYVYGSLVRDSPAHFPNVMVTCSLYIAYTKQCKIYKVDMV